MTTAATVDAPTTTTPSPPPTPQPEEKTYTSTTTPSSPSSSSSTMIASPQFDVIEHPVKDTLLIVSSLLSTLVHKNDSLYDPSRDPITLFHSRAVPRISIEAYLTRVLQYIPFTNEVLLNVLVFLDRIGGLEGIQLHQLQQEQPLQFSRGTPMNSTLSTTPMPSPCSPSSSSSLSTPPFSTASRSSQIPAAASTSTSPSTSFVSSPSSQFSRDPSFCQASSSNCNSAQDLPIIQKRGRDPTEEEESCKRSRVAALPSLTTTASTTSVAELTATATPLMPSAPVATTATNGFRVNSFNIHRLLITCLMVAAKFTSDLFYSNARYAKVGGLSLPELNQLELEFLFTTKFELNVKVDELQRVGNSLLQFRERQLVPACAVMQQQQQQQQQQQFQLQLQLQQQRQQQQQQQQLQLQQQQQQQQLFAAMQIQQQQQQFQQQQFLQQQQLLQQQQQFQLQRLMSVQQQQQPLIPVMNQSSMVFVPTMMTSTTTAPHQQGNVVKTHLLSPPEEKHKWTETEVHESNDQRIDHQG